MESALSFPDGGGYTASHDIQVCVVGQFEVIDASHDTRKVVIGDIWRFTWLANHREHGRETFETCVLN